MGKNIWDERFEDIRSFERHMARSGTVIRKFFLHVSKKEQKRRFLERLEEPEKTGSFRRPIFANANTGTTIRRPTKR